MELWKSYLSGLITEEELFECMCDPQFLYGQIEEIRECMDLGSRSRFDAWKRSREVRNEAA